MSKQLCYKCNHSTTDCKYFEDERPSDYMTVPEPDIEPPTMEEVATTSVTAIGNVFMLYDLTLKIGVEKVHKELQILTKKYENYTEEK